MECQLFRIINSKKFRISLDEHDLGTYFRIIIIITSAQSGHSKHVVWTFKFKLDFISLLTFVMTLVMAISFVFCHCYQMLISHIIEIHAKRFHFPFDGWIKKKYNELATNVWFRLVCKLTEITSNGNLPILSLKKQFFKKVSNFSHFIASSVFETMIYNCICSSGMQPNSWKSIEWHKNTFRFLLARFIRAMASMQITFPTKSKWIYSTKCILCYYNGCNVRKLDLFPWITPFELSALFSVVTKLWVHHTNKYSHMYEPFTNHTFLFFTLAAIEIVFR